MEPARNSTQRTAVTGATGQLGRLVITALLRRVPASSLVALVRDVSRAAELSALGVEVRQADFENPESLRLAFLGVDQVLLISSSEIGRRLPQHRNVINAAVGAGTSHFVYTSLLRADTSLLNLASEHKETELLLKASGLKHTVLRNGWYTENYTISASGAVRHGAFVGSAGQGRIASATRGDYAEAAAVVLSTPATQGRTYELAGDEAYTLAELAAEIARQSGKQVPYVNLPEDAYADILKQAGLPEALAIGLARWDVDASKGALFDEKHELSALIGRATTSLAKAVGDALSG